MRHRIARAGLVRSSLVVATVALGGWAQARAQGYQDYSLFGARGIFLRGATVNGGVVGSNNDVNVGGFSSFTALAGGGELNAQGPNVAGDVTFNGNVSLGGATVGGSIDSGRDVSLTSFARVHNITAKGDVNFNGSALDGNVVAGNNFSLGTFVTLNGNVAANNNVIINGSTIQGNVTYGNTLYFDTFGGSIKGTQTVGAVTANPRPYSPVTLPPAAQFTAGGPNLTSGGSQLNPLAPGSYGDIHLASFQDLYLRPGNYYFSSLEILNSQNIHLIGLTAQDHINVFVTGNITEGALSDTIINGKSFASADPTLARGVLFETLGNFRQDSLGADNIFGTIFAPNGDITFGQFSHVDGSVLAGGRVFSGPGFVENFAPSTSVPEPPALVMTAIGLGAAGASAFRRRHADRAS